MSLRIRLQRFGSKKRPYFHIVVAPSRSPRDGKFLEKLGIYSPIEEPPLFRVNSDRVRHWYDLGARPSDTVNALFRSTKTSFVEAASPEAPTPVS
jgi:small subunit ribosomal protein S16